MSLYIYRGTGIAMRDVTIEAVNSLYESISSGFGGNL